MRMVCVVKRAKIFFCFSVDNIFIILNFTIFLDIIPHKNQGSVQKWKMMNSTLAECFKKCYSLDKAASIEFIILHFWAETLFQQGVGNLRPA